MMKENKTELEQNIDKIIENSRKISNIFTLETARLIKAALINNKHSEKPVSELEVLQKMAKEREKAIVIYTNAGRNDLARIESKELDCIKEMIPKEPSEQEIEELLLRKVLLSKYLNLYCNEVIRKIGWRGYY